MYGLGLELALNDDFEDDDGEWVGLLDPRGLADTLTECVAELLVEPVGEVVDERDAVPEAVGQGLLERVADGERLIRAEADSDTEDEGLLDSFTDGVNDVIGDGVVS